jgi:XTP/dITP diphosphohydrolase
MPKLLIASRNPGKIVEIQEILYELSTSRSIELLTPADVGLALEVSESGTTYAENAGRKAKTFAQASGIVALGDDSGLEVEALDGAPGLYSARYLPQPGATDADRRAYLLENLRGHLCPWLARFRCCAAVASPDGALTVLEGTCDGEIIPEERGTNGFGYDPVFLIAGVGSTMAELSMAEKNRLSHRARAVRAAIPVLLSLL